MRGVRVFWSGLSLASVLSAFGCGGASTSSAGGGGSDDASSDEGSVGGARTGAGGRLSAGAGNSGSGGAGSGGAADGGAFSDGAGGGSVVTGGFIEAEILGELRRYERDAYTTTQGADEGYLIVSGRLDPNTYTDMFFIALPNQTGTLYIPVYWFGNNRIYECPCSIHVTDAGPEIGDVVKATFSGMCTFPNSDEMLPLTNGHFELPRIQ